MASLKRLKVVFFSLLFFPSVVRAESDSNKIGDIKTMTGMVKALTNWTIRFVIGIIQGFFSALRYGIAKGFSPFQVLYETLKLLFRFLLDFFDSFWNTLKYVVMKLTKKYEIYQNKEV